MSALTLPQYLVGVALFAAILAAACVVATTVTSRRFGQLRGAERALAWSVVATAALIASYLLPGILGVLNRWTPTLFGALLAAAAYALVPRAEPAPAADPAPPREAEDAPPEPLPERVVAAVTVLAAAAAAIAFQVRHATRPVENIDQLTSHLPVVARWIQTGSMWGVHDYVPYLGHGNYPQNGDVLSLAAISPWRFDAFQRFAQLPYFAVAGVAVYALGRRLGAPRAASAVLGAVLVSIPVAIIPSVAFSLPDAMMIAMFAAGLVFLARSDYLLAGVALGLAFGAKWYGVSAVVAVVALWALTLLAAGRGTRFVARAGVVVGAAVLAAGGFWLVRNAIGSGTPFYPGGWLPIGAHPANDLVATEGRGPVDFTVAHYAFDFHVWRHWLLPALYAAFRWPGVLLLAALPAGAVALLVDRRRGRLHRPALVALAAAVLLALVYTVTPASAQGLEGMPALAFPNARYLVPAAVPAAALAAWLCRRIGRWALAVELAGLVAVLDGAHHGLRFGWGAFAAALAALAAAAAVAYAARRAPRAALTGAAAALVVVAVVGGQLVQTRYARHRFAGLDPALTWIRQNAPSGSRVGLTGIWASPAPAPVYPSFGPRLRNHVEYVGPFRGGRIERYMSSPAFVSGLRASRSDVLIVGLGDPPVAHVVEQDWARDAGYVPLTRSRWYELYRRPGLARSRRRRLATSTAVPTAASATPTSARTSPTRTESGS